ncbi:MAG: exo-alpha-sialidase [Myxococcales bacterium]|nr:exo-alpha-sialidase [Myxococcales bacterium]
MLYVGTRKGLFTLDDAGAITDVAFRGDPVSAVLPLPDRLLVALRLGHFGVKVHARTKGAWAEMPAPAFPEKPADLEDKTPWSMDQVWTLAVDAHGTVWAGAIPGALFHLDDAGWTLMRGLWDRPERLGWFGGGYDSPGIHSVLTRADQPDTLTLGISCGGVWISTDRGATFDLYGDGLVADYLPPDRAGDKNTQDPHRLAACAAAPDRVWMQHHNGIFRSDDGGRTWTRLHPPVSGFGFGVAAHPTDPDTAWFVPGQKDSNRIPVDGAVVVNRTRDGGKTWETLRAGLPQQHAYDLTYRHALAVDATGTRLAFGSTTGNLWLSEDAGDTWRHLSAHLSPIYAVTFGA